MKAKPSKRAIANAKLDTNIVEIFAKNRGRYGAMRVTQELQAQGQIVGKNRVGKRMRNLELRALAKRKWKATTDSKHSLPIAANLLNRDWSTTGPNQKWLTDITYVWTQEGWLYLATVMDLYSRAIIGWALNNSIETSLISEALQKALWKRKFPKGVLVHSDRGSQYCSENYQKLLKDNGLICSMSRKGNCWDNSPMESFYHTLKIELVQFVLGFKTREEAREAITMYIEEYYNTQRRHSAIAYQVPFVFESISKCS